MAKPKVEQDSPRNEPGSTGQSDHNWKSNLVLQQIQASIRSKQDLGKECVDQIVRMADTITVALRDGQKVAFFGNGGSAADAEHIAAELVGKFAAVRPPLRAVAFTTNSSILTAIGNDFAFDQIFARQVVSQIDKDDVVVGISTSGSSENVINGIQEARRIGAKTIGLTGASGRKLGDICDHFVMVPSSNTQRIQESHILIGHIVCGMIETSLFDSESTVQRHPSPSRRTRSRFIRTTALARA